MSKLQSMTRITLLLFVFFVVHVQVNGQEEFELVWEKVSSADSITIDKTWTKFKLAIDEGDTAAVRGLSFRKVDCELCTKSLNSVVPIDTFIIGNMNQLLTSPIWKAVHKREYHLSQRTFYNCKLGIVPNSLGQNVEVYEVWIETYKPNEYVEGHEGQNHMFQFVRLNGEFKFHGMSSMP